MAGTYAHFALANAAHTKFIDSFEPSLLVSDSLDFFKRFRDLGAVSPDYPYLAPVGANGRKWADAMHYEHTVQFVSNGVGIVRAMPEGDDKQKAVAWLLGYASHVVGDCVIHPIVNWLVMGEYKKDPTEHRRCEMHQDVYIFKKVMRQDLGAAEYLKTSIAFCSSATQGLDPVIKQVWEEILSQTHPSLYISDPPFFDTWHQQYLAMLDHVVDLLACLPFSRHLPLIDSLTYPKSENPLYTDSLETPLSPMPYDEVFDLALNRVIEWWQEIDQALTGGADTCLTGVGEPNLDTGMEEEEGPCVLWPSA